MQNFLVKLFIVNRKNIILAVQSACLVFKTLIH